MLDKHKQGKCWEGKVFLMGGLLTRVTNCAGDTGNPPIHMTRVPPEGNLSSPSRNTESPPHNFFCHTLCAFIQIYIICFTISTYSANN